MNEWPIIQPIADANGFPTPAFVEWLQQLMNRMRNAEETATALEARVNALENP